MTINVKTAIMIMTTTMIMIIIIMMNMMMIGKESCEARQENHQRRNTQNNLLGPLTQAPRPPRLPSVWPTKFPKKHFVLIFHDNSDVDDDDGNDYVRMKMFLQ